jgi:intein/homing endonuclease
MAEVLGVLLGDGCVFRYESQRNHVFGVSFTAHESEFWYYRDFIKPVLEKTFDVHGRLSLRGDNTTRYNIYSKRLVAVLTGLGIPVGKRRDACIPKVVLDSGQVTSFIRGLYHAEGSIYRRYTKRYRGHAKVYDNLLVIQLRMKLKTLMEQVNFELLRLGIATNRLTEKNGVLTLRITNQSMIRRFIEVINPKYKTSPKQAIL